jgi:hypothetical protein
MVHIFCFTFIGLETKEARINAMRSAISETFPEPNRRLLQRLASHYSHRFQYWITYIFLGGILSFSSGFYLFTSARKCNAPFILSEILFVAHQPKHVVINLYILITHEIITTNYTVLFLIKC